MKASSLLLKILISFLILSYPLIVYLGFSYSSKRFTFVAIVLIFVLRAFFLRKRHTPIQRVSFHILVLTAIVCSGGALLGYFDLVKLYPILVSLGLASIFIYSLKGGQTPIIESLARLQDKNLSQHAILYTRRVTKIWIGFFVFNSIISLYTYLFCSLENWVFYNGFLSYIFIATIMGVEYIIRKLTQSRNPSRVLIVQKSPKKFYQCFISLLAKGKEVIILPNHQKGSLAEFSREFDERVEDIHTPTISLNLKSRISMFTSGSEGKPRKVIKDLSCLVNECNELESLFGELVFGTSFISTVSHQHIYGLLFRVLWPSLNDREISDENVFYPEQLRACLLEDKSFTLISSPTFLKRIKLEDFTENGEGKIEAIFSSGGKLEYHTAQKIKKIFGIWPTEIYGSTETGGIAFRTQEKKNEHWRLFPSVKAKIDSEGRLAISSPFILERKIYINDKLVFLNPDTFLLEGRTDRVFKVEEKRVALDELEQRILEMEDIEEAHCTVLELESRTIIACLVVESKRWKSIRKLEKIKALRSHLINHFEPILLPKKFQFLDQLPYNEQSKLDKRKLKGLFNEG